MFHRAVTSPRRGANATLAMLLFYALSAIAPKALPAAGIPILGQILGPDGKPRAKAEVRLESIPPTYERARLRLEGQPGPDPVARTRTGTDGTFELAAPEAGMWKVVVSAPGVLTTERRLITLVEETALPPVRLAPAADLMVRLVDSKGKPRPGTVGAYTLGARTDAWRPQLRLARAGEDGVAHLPLGQGEKIQLEVLADGHPLAVFELFDESSVTIDLPVGIAGTVRVTGRRQQPLAGAVAFQGSALLPLGLSDEEGRIPLVLQAKQPPALKVSAADRQNGTFELDFGAAGDSEKVLRLDPPATVSGRVLDLSNRDPVAGALVWAVRGELAVTDRQGRYALDVGIYKSRWLQAAATGYQQGHSQLADTGGGQAPAIALAPATALSGKVVDGEGGLLEGVAIELRLLPQGGPIPRASRHMMREGWRGRTSDRGAFRVAGLPAGVGFQLSFKAEGFAPHTQDVEPLEPFESRSGLEVVLEPGRVAFGRVVDEDEVPVAGAEVSLKPPPPSDDLRATMMMGRSEDAPEASVHLTDAEGRFEIADLAAGRYDLEVHAAGFAPAKVPGVRVPEAGGADLGTVVLIPGASIEGRVTGPGGAAITGAEITVEVERQNLMGVDPSSPQAPTKTDTAGRFVVADLLPGQAVRLSVTKEGYGSESLSDLRPPTDEPLAIQLEPAGRLEGQVVDQRGEPVEGATVMANPDRSVMAGATVVRQQRRPAWARTGADGHFLIADVEPGLLEVTARAEGYQHLVRTGIEIEAGGALELELVLEAGAVVEGTLTTTDGEPVAEGSISVSERQDGLFTGRSITASGLTDVEGYYRVTGAPTGPATITAQHDGRRLMRNVEVRPGTNVVDLVLERGFEITGQVVAPDGNPVGGASLSIRKITQPGMTHYSFGSSQVVSTAAGTFTITGVSAGNYTVTAAREGYAHTRSEVFEVSGDVTGLLLELSYGASLKGRVLGLELDELGSLELVAMGEGGMRRGRVDFSAEYAFDSLAPGRWHVQAQIAGSGRMAMLQVEIPEGLAEVEKDIEFDTGLLTLTGIVLDAGQPLAGARINVVGSMSNMGRGATGDDGRFRIDNLKAGNYQVMVIAGGTGIQHMEALELVGDHELRIEIATGTVAGIVRDAAGEPLAGVAVALEPLEVDEDSPWNRQYNFGNQTESDSGGYFQVPRVRRGNWRVVATKQGYGPGEATVAVAGGVTPEVDIRLTPTDGVSFEVALESGATVPVVQVVILDPSGRRLAVGGYMVIEGRVQVSTVPAGRWHLVIQGGDSAATRFAVTAPGDQGLLVLPTGGSLNIRVPELEQEMMASVVLSGPDGKPFVSTTGAAFDPGEWMMSAGQSLVPGLTPGVWSFTVKHQDGRTWSGNATVTPGAMTEVILP